MIEIQERYTSLSGRTYGITYCGNLVGSLVITPKKEIEIEIDRKVDGFRAREYERQARKLGERILEKEELDLR